MTYGWLAPPSRKDPLWETAEMRSLGPTIQQTRQPGSRLHVADKMEADEGQRKPSEKGRASEKMETYKPYARQ